MQLQSVILKICAKGMVNIKTYLISISSVILLIVLAIVSYILLGNEKYMLTAIIAAIISCIPFFVRFHKKNNSSREVVTIAVMIALCVASRIIFIIVPHFKPVTALIIITSLYFGADAGFITGSFTALLSNMQYGQGPWTIFQMTSWGLIGFAAGALNKRILKNKFVLYMFSAISGVVFSLIMDIYTVISVDYVFSFSRYLSYVFVSIPVMLEYVVSNAVFMLILYKPIGKKLERVKTKYGIFT